MATTAGQKLTLDPMGKCSNAFFSETTKMIKAKLYMNVHVLKHFSHRVQCKTKSCSSHHFEFHIGTKDIKFVEDHPMNIHVQTKLPRNDHWKVLYNVYVFYADRKSKMATTAGQRLTLDPMGKCSNACRSHHFEFHIRTKNVKFVKNHPMNIHMHVQFGFNHICSF
jgi:hypothetical protein